MPGFKDIPQSVTDVAAKLLADSKSKEIERLKALEEETACDDKEEVEEEISEEGEGDKEAYQKVFNAHLKKYKVKSPEDLSDDKKKEFFNAVDAAWKSDKEEKGISEATQKDYVKKKLVQMAKEVKATYAKAKKLDKDDPGDAGIVAAIADDLQKLWKEATKLYGQADKADKSNPAKAGSLAVKADAKVEKFEKTLKSLNDILSEGYGGTNQAVRWGEVVKIDTPTGTYCGTVVGIDGNYVDVRHATGDEIKVHIKDIIKEDYDSSGDADDEDDQNEKQREQKAHGGDPQLGEAYYTSPEPNSAVGQRRESEKIKTAEVIADFDQVGGYSYRLLVTWPNSRPELIPSAAEVGTTSVDELEAKVLDLFQHCGHCTQIVKAAIDTYRDRAADRPEHSSNTELGASGVDTPAHDNYRR